METKIVYFDESGDTGIIKTSSNAFVLTSCSVPAADWQKNFDIIRSFRKHLKDQYNLPLSEEIHTKNFVYGKYPYFKKFGIDAESRKALLQEYNTMIGSLSINIVNVVINKGMIGRDDNYNVLDTALTFNLQRIDNTSSGVWNYLIITDPGRTAEMVSIARKRRVYNPIRSHFGGSYNSPLRYMIEDILEKDSMESYFIQISDYISFIVMMYFRTKFLCQPLSKTVETVLGSDFAENALSELKEAGVLNLKASKTRFGIVVTPK